MVLPAPLQILMVLDERWGFAWAPTNSGETAVLLIGEKLKRIAWDSDES